LSSLHASPPGPLETYERLGAHPWAECAAEELRATGERVARRDPTAAGQSTPKKLRIARSRAAPSNREAGAALFLSATTIEAHVGRGPQAGHQLAY